MVFGCMSMGSLKKDKTQLKHRIDIYDIYG